MMTRQLKALQLSCGIHALLMLAIIGAARTVSVPLCVDLMDFTLLDASGLEMSAPALPVAGKVGQEARPEEPVADSKPPIIKQRQQKVVLPAPRLEAESAETTPIEPALAESFFPEETAAASAESPREKVLPKSVDSASDIAGPAPSGPPNPSAAQPATRSAATEQHSQSSQDQYLANHFATIRDRILRNLRYPAVARKKGWSGQVRLSFRIDHKGGVEDITVLASSGYDLLDRQAMDVVRLVAPFPLPLENAEITMPITFSLSR